MTSLSTKTVGLLVFGVCVGLLAAHFLSANTGLFENYLKRETMPEMKIPVEREYYYSEPPGGSLSQDVLYHNIGPSIENAKAADILFISNSRLQSGVRDWLVKEADRLGIRIFSLGMGHGESVRFAMKLIKRHNIRPKILVSAGDSRFYLWGESNVAKRAQSRSRWTALKNYWEKQALWFYQRTVHRLLPKLSILNDSLDNKVVHYRSNRHGFWILTQEPDTAQPVSERKPRNVNKRVQRAVLGLEEEMARLGVPVVFTQVPSRRTDFSLLRWLEENNRTVIIPETEGLYTYDRSHLNAESAKIFADRLWPALMDLPEIQAALNPANE